MPTAGERASDKLHLIEAGSTYRIIMSLYASSGLSRRPVVPGSHYGGDGQATEDADIVKPPQRRPSDASSRRGDDQTLFQHKCISHGLLPNACAKTRGTLRR